jgi:hypothetical protein
MSDEDREREERLKKLDAAVDDILEYVDRIQIRYNFNAEDMYQLLELLIDRF